MTKTENQVAFTPIEDRVLVLHTEAETGSVGGIVLPDSSQERPLSGTVVAVGPGQLSKDGKRLDMPVACGDEVVFGKYAGNEIEFEGQEYKVLRATELLAKINR